MQARFLIKRACVKIVVRAERLRIPQINSVQIKILIAPGTMHQLKPGGFFIFKAWNFSILIGVIAIYIATKFF